MSADTAQETYRKLQIYLDGQPGGFPATDTGSDIEYLKWMFTPEEAEVEVQMRSIPEPAEAIAQRCGKPVPEVSDILENMVSDGLVLPVPRGGKTYYMAMQYEVGFMENQWAHRLTPERAAIAQKYTEDSAITTDFVKQKQMRVVPVAEAIEVQQAMIAPYNHVKDIIRNQELIATSICPCRMMKKNLGEGCDHPIGNELSFGLIAQYRIDNGFGRKLREREALAIIDEAEELAMVVSPVNTQEDIAMCICCSCGCYWLQGLKKQDRPVEYVQSAYQAVIDPEKCDECRTCIERCQMDAVIEKDGSMEIDLARCIGCGLCVTRCPEEAASLNLRPGMEAPPATYLGQLAGIAVDRDLPLGKNKWLLNRMHLDSFTKQWQFLDRMHLAQPVLNFMEKRGML